MIQPRVLLWSNDRLISRMIKYRTGSKWTHAAVYISGATYDSTLGGARWRIGMVESDLVLKLKMPATPQAIDDLIDFCERSLKHNWPYNVLKLITLWIV